MLLGRHLLVVTVLVGMVTTSASAQQCDDSEECTTNDMCSDGECMGTPASGGSCDDGNPCTNNDTCTNGSCAGTLVENGTPCNDQIECTTDDTCLVQVISGFPPIAICTGFPAAGSNCQGGCGTCSATLQCMPKPDSVGMACDPGFEKPCTEAHCQTLSGFAFCRSAVRECPDTDGNKCTDNCNPATGQCEHDAPHCLPPCQSCNEATGACLPANLGAACEDLDPCTTQSSCRSVEGFGFCLAGAPTGPTQTPTPTMPGPTATVSVATATPTIPFPTSTPTRTRVVGTPTPTLLAGLCVGDCNHDNFIRTNELIIGVEIALARIDLEDCSGFDANHDNKVLVDELMRAVDGARHGCSGAAAAP